MYDDFKVANYSKSLVSPELYARPISRLFTGDVIDGLTVAPGTGLQVVLSPGNAMVRYGSSAVASARLVSLVNSFNLSIDTADVSNPRIDLVVLYIDNSVSLPSGTPTTANLDGKGVAKAKIVKGAAAASPTAPNSTAIQASVGAGNPYTVVAQVRVNAGVTVIAGDKVTDVRSMAVTSKIDLTTFSRIAIAPSANTPLGNTETDLALNSTKYSFGSGLTRSGNTVVIGAGITRVKVSCKVFGDGMTGNYLYILIKKGATVVDQGISGNFATGFSSVAIPAIEVDVVTGDVIKVTTQGLTAGVARSISTWLVVEAV